MDQYINTQDNPHTLQGANWLALLQGSAQWLGARGRTCKHG